MLRTAPELDDLTAAKIQRLTQENQSLRRKLLDTQCALDVVQKALCIHPSSSPAETLIGITKRMDGMEKLIGHLEEEVNRLQGHPV